MKKLITHINPHLDDIAGIWLLKKFYPGFSKAAVEFISADEGKGGLSEDVNTLFIGVGKGRFDEHKEGIKEDCATSLIWKYLKNENLTPKDELGINAMGELVEWVRLIDLGLKVDEFSDFSIPAIVRSRDSSKKTSLKSISLGEEILNRVLEILKRKHQGEKDWEDRVEFESKFGKSYAIKSDVIGRPFCVQIGGELFLMVEPTTGFVQFFTPHRDIDLEPIYKKVKKLDPDADWFLHQSHHMVICGSGSAPDAKKTRLSFEELIEAAKSA